MKRVDFPTARAALIASALATAALALGGCGFTPLYGAPGVIPKLASIDIVKPQGRTGFLLSQHLEDAFAKDPAARSAYTMRLTLAEARYPRGVRTDAVATRYEYVLTADYALANNPAGDIAKTGRVRVEVTYDSADQPYASIAAQQDAEDRAAQEAARRIQLELAAWLATGQPSGKAPPRVVAPPANSTSPGGPPTGN